MGAVWCNDARRPQIILNTTFPEYEDVPEWSTEMRSAVSAPNLLTGNDKRKRWNEENNFHPARRTTSPDLLSRRHDEKKVQTPKKSRVQGKISSLQAKVREHQQNRDKLLLEGESEAIRYMNVVEDDTLKHAENAVRISESILGKSDDICEELVRQREVIHQSTLDLNIVEHDIDESHHTLNGMKSIGGKMANVLWHKKPEAQAYSDSGSKKQSRLSKKRRTSVPDTIGYRKSSGNTKQDQVNQSVRQLCLAMDTISNRQLDITEEIEHQNEELGKMSSCMGRTGDKIKSQTSLMHSIREG